MFRESGFGNIADILLARHFQTSTDLDDWMRSAQEQEAAFFGDASPIESAEESDAMPVSAPRASIVEWFKLMLSEYGLSSKFPNALTLFDAIHAAERTDLQEQVRSSHITVLGIVLVLVKLHKQKQENAAQMILRLLDVKDLSGFFRSFDLDVSGAFVLVTRAAMSEEMQINKMLASRTLSPSPPEWAAVIVWRLFLSIGGSRNEIAMDTLPLISYFATTLHEHVATNSRFTPKALAVVACALGLMASNAMDCNVKPQLSVRKPFSFECLAKMAHCSEEDVHDWAFNVGALTESCIRKPQMARSTHVNSPSSQASSCTSWQKPLCSAIPKMSTLFDMNVEEGRHWYGGDVLTIVVIRFPRQALPEDLRALFRCCGETESAQVVLDRHGASRCYGFVRFCGIESIQVAIQACKDEKITMTDNSDRVFVLKANLAQKNIPEIIEGDRSTIAFSCRADDNSDLRSSYEYENMSNQALHGHHRRRPPLCRNSSPLDNVMPKF